MLVLAALACSLPYSNDGAHEQIGSSDDSIDSDGYDADGDGHDASIDCDDDEPAVYPGAKETCGNGRDDNCNGTPDGCDWSGELELEGTELTTPHASSRFGTALAICDANGDGVGDAVVGAPGFDAAYVFYGPIGEDREAEEADHVLVGREKPAGTGFSIDCRRDIDGDAISDIMVGEPRAGGTTIGRVYIVPGGGTGDTPIDNVASSTWFGSDEGDEFGYQLVAIETDGDDADELAVTLWVDQPAIEFGTVYVIDGATPGEHGADEATATIYGAALDRLDPVVGNAGDLDGDGLEDLVLGGRNGINAEALVFTAPFQGAIPKSAADVRILGGPPPMVQWSGMGHADLDGDGRDDLFLGNGNDHDSDGAAYAFLAPVESDTTATAADLQLLGPTYHRWLAGSDVTSPGDVDGDGTRDLLVGALGGGTVYLQYGGSGGVYLLGTAAQAWWQQNDGTGTGSIVAAGDVTGDGIVEFLIGSPGDSFYSEGGRVTIVPSFEI